MKTIKREIMKFEPHLYILWIICSFIGYYSYMNPPEFIYIHTSMNIFSKVFELSWTIVVVLVTSLTTVWSTSLAKRVWKDKIEPWYNKKFSKKRNQEQKRK